MQKILHDFTLFLLYPVKFPYPNIFPYPVKYSVLKSKSFSKAIINVTQSEVIIRRLISLFVYLFKNTWKHSMCFF